MISGKILFEIAFALFMLLILLIGGSVIYTDLTYPWKKGVCRNPLFAYKNKRRK